MTQPAPPFGREDELPRLPLPALADSCARFLDWCAPLLTPGELAQTAAAVRAFGAAGGPGPRLQAALADYDAAGRRSYLDAFWAQRYLGRRTPTALNANFFFLFSEDSLRAAAPQQADRAAALAVAAVRYKLALESGAAGPVITRGAAQSMEQHRHLFATTRIPGEQQDTVRSPFTIDQPEAADARHIVVFWRGGMFRLDVLGPGGEPRPVADLAAALREITRRGPAAPGTSAGHLTTTARARWAANRQALLACSPGNRGVLEQIETALFCVCLEDTAPAGVREACDRLLAGSGANRWYDKALSLIVFPDGTAGLNAEHCLLDGTTVLAFTDAVLAALPAAAADGPGTAPAGGADGGRAGATPSVQPLELVLDDALRAEVAAAQASFAAAGAAAASVVLTLPDFGSDRAKQLGFSPDAFVQMAYQLAYHRVAGAPGATYESIATRQYQWGRTEAMRVVTPESVRFTQVMADPAASPADRSAALRAAAAAHVQRSRDCQAGQVPEQHLWELAMIAGRRGAELGVPELPGLYSSPGWLVMRDDRLSTSSAPSAALRYFGFGSTGAGCIGVGYVLLPGRLSIYLSAADPARLAAFAAAVPAAVADLAALAAEVPAPG